MLSCLQRQMIKLPADCDGFSLLLQHISATSTLLYIIQTKFSNTLILSFIIMQVVLHLLKKSLDFTYLVSGKQP